MRTYTGVGSRSTPGDVLERMERMAFVLASRGVILRTGGAAGADSAFERGCDRAAGPKQVYLPWEGFSGRAGAGFLVVDDFESLAMAESVHPNWGSCSPSARALHARNVCQVLGADLSTPSLFVVCWTPGGRPVGGTRTAIVVAGRAGVPVFNLASRPWTLREILREVVRRRRVKRGEE